MISKYLSSIDGVSVYPIVALCIFIPFFIVVTVWVLRLKKNYLVEMSNMPLNDSENPIEKRKTSL